MDKEDLVSAVGDVVLHWWYMLVWYVYSQCYEWWHGVPVGLKDFEKVGMELSESDT